MDTVTILRQLWRSKLLVACVAILAVLTGMIVLYRYTPPLKLESRKYEVGVASARILVDTPASLVVDIAPKGSDVIGGRATLLANLMLDGDIKTGIARKAGLPPDKLVSPNDADDIGGPGTRPNPRAFIIDTKVLTTQKGDSLPIIQVEAQAPDAAGAERLANAAVNGLREFLDSKAAGERVPFAQRLRISQLSPAQGRLAVRGPRNAFGVLAAIFVFGLGCAAILMVAALIRGLRADPAAAYAPAKPHLDPVPMDAAPRWPEDEPEWEAFSPPADAVDGGAAVNGSAGAHEDAERLEEPAPAMPMPKQSGSWWGGGPA